MESILYDEAGKPHINWLCVAFPIELDFPYITMQYKAHDGTFLIDWDERIAKILE